MLLECLRTSHYNQESEKNHDDLAKNRKCVEKHAQRSKKEPLRDDKLSTKRSVESFARCSLITHFASIDFVTVVEPSQRLLSNFKKIILDGSKCEFPYIKSLHELGYLDFETSSIASVCAHVDFTLIEAPFARGVVDENFELAMCLNVLDQCESPKELVDGLKEATALNGVLVLSCSYQWNKKKRPKVENEAVNDINDYFDDGWVNLSEDEHEYKIRYNERYSLLFLSHIVAYKKVGA